MSLILICPFTYETYQGWIKGRLMDSRNHNYSTLRIIYFLTLFLKQCHQQLVFPESVHTDLPQKHTAGKKHPGQSPPAPSSLSFPFLSPSFLLPPYPTPEEQQAASVQAVQNSASSSGTHSSLEWQWSLLLLWTFTPFFATMSGGGKIDEHRAEHRAVLLSAAVNSTTGLHNSQKALCFVTYIACPRSFLQPSR